MERYKLSFRQSVAKDLRRLPGKDVKRILDRIKSLRTDPRAEGCSKLSDQERYRVRQGKYRIVYEILDSELTIQVVKVAHRGEVYKGS